jgi:hypothetical protein
MTNSNPRPLVPVDPQGLDDVAVALLKSSNEDGRETRDSSGELPVNVQVSHPEKYLFLPSKTYGNYTYPNTLFSLERGHNGKNWHDTHKSLAAEGAYMPTIRQFVDAVKLLRSGKARDGKGKIIAKNLVNVVLDDIFKLGSYRGRWLDADFKVFNGVLHINYGHTVDVNGKLSHKYSEPLTNCLMTDRKPGIKLDEWINRATEHGLPPTDIAQGDIWYFRPLEDNNSVAWFFADSGGAVLGCGGGPAVRGGALGVHVARKIGSVR